MVKFSVYLNRHVFVMSTHIFFRAEQKTLVAKQGQYVLKIDKKCQVIIPSKNIVNIIWYKKFSPNPLFLFMILNESHFCCQAAVVKLTKNAKI